jgi:hypothetical protein
MIVFQPRKGAVMVATVGAKAFKIMVRAAVFIAAFLRCALAALRRDAPLNNVSLGIACRCNGLFDGSWAGRKLLNRVLRLKGVTQRC